MVLSIQEQAKFWKVFPPINKHRNNTQSFTWCFVSYTATKGAEFGRTLIRHFSKPQLKRTALLFLRFQMLIAAGYLSNALVKVFSRTKVLQQSIFTVEQMS